MFTDQVESSDHNSNNTETEASDSWDVEEKAADNGYQGDLLNKLPGFHTLPTFLLSSDFCKAEVIKRLKLRL